MMNDDANEPDWESICANVQIGDAHYWTCAAKREELEILKEMRQEAPFEERLMERAQPVPEPPGVVRERKLAELEAKKRVELKHKLEKRKEPARGLSGLFEELTEGELGRTLMWAGPLAVLAAYWWFSRSSSKQGDMLKVWGVRWTSGDKQFERLFVDAQVSAQFAEALRQAGAQGIMIATTPIEVKANDPRLAKNTPTAQASAGSRAAA